MVFVARLRNAADHGGVAPGWRLTVRLATEACCMSADGVAGAGSSISMSIMPGVVGASPCALVRAPLRAAGANARFAGVLRLGLLLCTALSAARRTSGAIPACSSS
jgi:hypothetical protein